MYGFCLKIDNLPFWIAEKIRNALDNKNHTCDVFIDLKKAFDTMNHTVLLDKLKYYGVRRIKKIGLNLFLNTDTNILILKNVALNSS